MLLYLIFLLKVLYSMQWAFSCYWNQLSYRLFSTLIHGLLGVSNFFRSTQMPKEIKKQTNKNICFDKWAYVWHIDSLGRLYNSTARKIENPKLDESRKCCYTSTCLFSHLVMTLSEQIFSTSEVNYTGSVYHSGDAQVFLPVMCLGCSFFHTDRCFFFSLKLPWIVPLQGMNRKFLNNCALFLDQGCFLVGPFSKNDTQIHKPTDHPTNQPDQILFYRAVLWKC